MGRLAMSIQGYKERDCFVLDLIKRNNIPLQVGMGGGYSIYLIEIIIPNPIPLNWRKNCFFKLKKL